MLNDASWDYENIQSDGTMYSQTISNILNGKAIETSTTQTTQQNEEPKEKNSKPNVRVINGRSVISLRGKVMQRNTIGNKTTCPS